MGDERLSGRAVAAVVKELVSRCGPDPSRYPGHSLRSGLATLAAAAGASERSIMRQTGHKSLPLVRRYIRVGSLFRENAAAVVGLRPPMADYHAFGSMNDAHSSGPPGVEDYPHIKHSGTVCGPYGARGAAARGSKHLTPWPAVERAESRRLELGAGDASAARSGARFGRQTDEQIDAEAGAQGDREAAAQ